MPIHDWARVDAGIYHHFHHRWIGAIAEALNAGRLPEDYYALAEQFAANFGPDVVALQGSGDQIGNGHDSGPAVPPSGSGGVLLAPPKVQPVGETDMAFYRRKQNIIAVRHVSGDRVVAIVEIVSPGNKAAQNPLRAFVRKAAELIEQGIHLLIIDLFPPGRRDPQGLHNEIWQEIAGEEYAPPPGKPLEFIAYDAGGAVRAYVFRAAVADEAPDVPLFLVPGLTVTVPLEATYGAAFAAVPRRWRRVLEAPPSAPG